MDVKNVPGVNILQGAVDTLMFKPVFKRIERYEHDMVMKIKDDGRKYVLGMLAHDDSLIIDASKSEKYGILDPSVELEVLQAITPGVYRMYQVAQCATTVTLKKMKGEPRDIEVKEDINGTTVEIVPDGTFFKMIAKTGLIDSVLDNNEARNTFVDHISYTLVFLAFFIGAVIFLVIGMILGAMHI